MNRLDILLILILQWIYQFSTQMYMPLFLNYMPTQRCETVPDSEEIFCYNVEMKCNRCISSNCTVEASICTDQACVDEITNRATFHSAAMDYGHYCDPKFRFLRTEFVQYAGVFFGTIIFGALADIFGRKKVVLIGLSIGLPIMLLSGEIHNFVVFYVCRFFTGFFNGCTMVVGWGYISELISANKRMCLCSFATYPMSRCIITLICYLCEEWRLANRVIVIVIAPLILVIAFVLPESHIWLASKGKQKEYDAAIERLNKLAGYEYYPKKTVEKKEKDEKAPSTGRTLLKLIVHPTLRRRILCMFSLWFVTLYTAYGLTLNSDTMSRYTFYTGQFILCGLLICAKMGMGALDTFVPGMNRRRLHQLFQGTSLLGVVVVITLMLLGSKGTIPFTISYMVASIFIELCADICYLAVNELMPTQIRGVATGLCSMIGRVSTISTGLANSLKDIWEPGLFLVFFVLGTFNWLVSFFFLDETKGIDLNEVGKDLMSTRTEKSTSKTDERELLTMSDKNPEDVEGSSSKRQEDDE